MKRKALRAAFPYTVSIWVEFLFLGLSYGLLMKSMGLPIFYILAMSIFIFAGSMEFVTVNLLVGAFQPLNAFIMTLMVNATCSTVWPCWASIGTRGGRKSISSSGCATRPLP